jgi:hypothetical protein
MSRLGPTIQNPDFKWSKQDGCQKYLASLDRFIKKGNKNIFFHAKTVYTSVRILLSDFWSVQYSNVRDWHKIESEYRPLFGIRWPTIIISSSVFMIQL